MLKENHLVKFLSLLKTFIYFVTKKKDMDLPALKALFLIVSKGRPDFKEPDKMSEELKDFINVCTKMEPQDRPTSEELSKVRKKKLLFGFLELIFCSLCKQHKFLTFANPEGIQELLTNATEETRKSAADLVFYNQKKNPTLLMRN